MHAQEIFRKREVARSDRDSIRMFSKGRKIEKEISDRDKGRGGGGYRNGGLIENLPETGGNTRR